MLWMEEKCYTSNLRKRIFKDMIKPFYKQGVLCVILYLSHALTYVTIKKPFTLSVLKFLKHGTDHLYLENKFIT